MREPRELNDIRVVTSVVRVSRIFTGRSNEFASPLPTRKTARIKARSFSIPVLLYLFFHA